jgi:4-diphosphocytidyl-2C-methyl-D-erythritol kinase
MPLLTIKAPAKINLHLRVKNRRPDGYHSLESIFVALNFGDTLHFEPCSPEFNGEGGYFRADHWGGGPEFPAFF